MMLGLGCAGVARTSSLRRGKGTEGGCGGVSSGGNTERWERRLILERLGGGSVLDMAAEGEEMVPAARLTKPHQSCKHQSH